ncbi:hypothetical protein DEO72_LG2g4113 [Vigna unguiculata]|uniref:Uncharacterized protein n=1 Tax=Vigna unguiculata TaxID=3917 RepID=A0A4D6L5L6_VIGUN|nr:hypothetical protein DEO72_LG2g4113 [Vigna unguiculata]
MSSVSGSVSTSSSGSGSGHSGEEGSGRSGSEMVPVVKLLTKLHTYFGEEYQARYRGFGKTKRG